LASLAPELVKACKGHFLIDGKGIEVFAFLTPSSLALRDMGSAMSFWEEVWWLPLASLPGAQLTEENER